MNIAALILSSTSLFPQSVPPATMSLSPMAGTPHGLSVDADTYCNGQHLAMGVIYIKEPGFRTTAPLPATEGIPDFSAISNILSGANLNINAHSIGIDWISLQNGLAVPGSAGWGAITFSVTRATVGGGVIGVESQMPDGAAADLFLYVLEGSSLPANLVGQTSLAQDSPGINIASPGLPGDMDAHDIPMSGNLTGSSLQGFIPDTISYFFSVSHETRFEVDENWWNGSTPSGATIFVTEWSDQNASWGPVGIAWTHEQLGLGPSEDVDALSVDVVHQRILVSTRSHDRDALLAGEYSGLGQSVELSTYTASDGIPISQKMGILATPDDIDAVCCLDPRTSPLHARMVATPLALALPFVDKGLSASGFHWATRTSEEMKIILGGWPRGNAARGSAQLGVIVPGSSIVYWGPIHSRTASGTFPGCPIQETFTLPPTSSAVGLDYYFQGRAWSEPLPGVPLDVRYSLPITMKH